jgi:hypothetical protein
VLRMSPAVIGPEKLVIPIWIPSYKVKLISLVCVYVRVERSLIS